MMMLKVNELKLPLRNQPSESRACLGALLLAVFLRYDVSLLACRHGPVASRRLAKRPLMEIFLVGYTAKVTDVKKIYYQNRLSNQEWACLA